MTTPLEKAARALAARRRAKNPSELDRQRALAVLKAIREPTPDAIKAGSCGGDWPHAAETWQAMIDHITEGKD